ncbi:hypothetical conserved protein [Candidatus Nitrosoglobus terrae]|uniref:Hypothetical conserved protein n=1 Tax=Candidatus Nitrosoglobus terrae TaxID=1630141 RepID=A0A1Q2SLB4_9GAMM|nr:DUF262 domain-containing protein [Candidatus Nitrosoglobus terrae]BAW79892.1 hypothetical conserved protein [Candidatus Nitrosoglobus terrae]
MSFQTPITIAEAVHKITENSYLLPAIQREFVWSHDKIEWLFDSIMKSYPISSFLFWEVKENAKKYKFYKFISEFRERYKTHNEEISTNGLSSFIAILDGQQRLTALYIGLKGNYAYKVTGKRWEDTERNIPTRRLYLNIDEKLSDQEDGRVYEFKFLIDSNTHSQRIYKDSRNISWFKVGEILNFPSDEDLDSFIESFSAFSKNTIRQLRRVITRDTPINFFLLKSDQEIDTALNIFIRINSGGKPLDFSDLVMSMVIANWVTRDARKEIHQLVDNIQDKGFTISKDLILRAYLYLYSADITFTAKNFSKENSQSFEKEWDKIRDCLLSTFDLMKVFGFNDSTLISKNSILPIAYYLYHKDIYEDYSTKIKYKEDRVHIKTWLHISLLKQVFGGVSNNTLSQIRQAFTGNIRDTKITSGIDFFPSEKIFSHIRKEASVGEEFIAELLITQYKHKHERSFSLLSLLFPHLDYENNAFHKDHLHPVKQFEAISQATQGQYNEKDYHSIVNLQMLNANENSAKQEISLAEWIDQEPASRDRTAFLEAHLLPTDMTDFSIHNFDEFYTKRKILLTEKLTELLK